MQGVTVCFLSSLFFYNVEKIIIEINLDDCWKMKLKNNIFPFDFFYSFT